jgi:GNAT superfamily N-acetyltransferase
VRKEVDGLHRIARLNLVTAKVEVRPGSDADLATLVAVLGERHFFTDSLARQQRGGGVLLVAWLDGQPAGEVFLDCEPAEEPEIRRHLPGVPRLGHLEVPGPLWGRGIGTALIRAAEDSARQLGYERIRLSVGLDNLRARRLYGRLGYADWGRGTVVGTWVGRPDDGPPVMLSETCSVLVKRL